MKINKQIREAYADFATLNAAVRKAADNHLRPLQGNWHYISRIKSEESYALKFEKGLCDDDLSINDFFACTIVVQNTSEISKAEDIVRQKFVVVKKRPEHDRQATSRPSEFQFDDLRIYVKLRAEPWEQAPIFDVVFEVQIKTFLQHAWGIATHDLTYKTDEVSWARFRVASQIRAMLEHAELSIDRFNDLSDSDIIHKEYSDYATLDEIIRELRLRFDAQALPTDMRRLAEAVNGALSLFTVTVSECMEYLDSETMRGYGSASLDHSPYGAILQSVLRLHPVDVSKALNKSRGRRFRPIRLPESVEIPDKLSALVPDVIRRI